MRWFAQHTRLLGDGFDFHADPRRILAGRAFAIALLLAYSHAFDWSPYAGLAVVVVLCAIGPLLFASAQRFRLANTSWRGLRFGFEVTAGQVYAVCLPAIFLWTWGSVWIAFQTEGTPGERLADILPAFVLSLSMPFLHARLKRLQHERANFGGLHFEFRPAGLAFFWIYLVAGVVMTLGVLAGLLVGAVIDALLGMFDVLAVSRNTTMNISAAAVGLLMFVSAWPYLAARLQRVVWEHTQGGPLRFRGEMKAWPLMRLVLGRSLLTLVTFGLYWPFAAVAIARYRVQSLVIEADVPLEEVALQRSAQQGNDRSAGDAAADFFGLDLGW
jgi:uncharacterized membrane protein YjgN (DUF898 family)